MYDTEQNFWKVTFFHEFHRFNCTCENFIPGKFTLELVVLWADSTETD